MHHTRGWLLLLLAVLGSAASALAQTVTIGSTTVPVATPATSSYFYGPIYRSSVTSVFNYSRYAHLYTAAELGIPNGATITQLEWLKADAGAVTGANTLNVLLANSAATTLATGSTWGTLTAGATSVYTNAAQDVTGAAGTYLTVPTTGFTYTGGNLLVFSDWTKGGTATAAVNFVTNPAAGLALGVASDVVLTTTTPLVATSYGDRRPTLRITYAPGVPCTAPPTAGTASASATTLCAGNSVSLSLTGTTVGTGVTFQWQSSATGVAGSYTNIAGATGSTYVTPVLGQTTYYRAVVTCSGQSATSTVVQVTVLAPTYAAVPYTQGFENTWLSRCNTGDVPDANWLNTPATGNNSWRRDDDGSSAGWTTPTGGAYTPAGSDAGGASSAHSARFHNYYAPSASVGTLDLYLNLTGGTGTPTLKFDYRNSDSNPVVVQLSTDGGATFPTTLQTLGTQTAWTSYLLNLPATVTATTVVRFRATSNFGSADNGLDNVSVSYIACAQPTALAATINATAATASATVTFAPAAGATSYTLSISPAVVGAPTTVTTSPFTLTGLAYSTTYTLTLTTNCGTTTSGAATYTFTTPCAPPAYATLPYTQGFENTWLSRCDTDDAPDASWANTPVTGNNSWRRDDDGASANWSSPTGGALAPTGSQGSSHAARFHAYYASSGTIGTLDLYANLGATGTKRLTFDYVNPSTDGSKLEVLLSTDGGATFAATPLLTVNTAAAFATQTVDIPNATATSVIRFRATSDFGDFDLGIDNVQLRVLVNTDLAATALATPTATQGCYGSAEAVSVVVTNLGGQAISFATNPATVTAVVTTPGGSQTLTGTVTTGTLAAGATQTVTLAPTLNMTALGTYSFAITATVTGDLNTANDLLTPAPTRTVAAPVAGTLASALASLCQSGTATLTLTGAANGNIQFQSSTSATGTFTDIAGATSAVYTTPVLTSTTYYRVLVRCGTSTATSNVSAITVNNPQVASVNGPLTICGGTTATITATPAAGSTVRFFTAATGGTALTTTTAGSYTTPALTANTTYYAEAYASGPETAGRPAPTVTTGFVGIDTGLIFTTTAALNIQSAVIYPVGTGTITFALRNSANVELAVTPAIAVTGTGAATPITVQLNLQVPAAGTDYRLVVKSFTGITDLLRENPLPTGFSYPLTSPSGAFSITNGINITPLAAYYYFYNMVLSSGECVSTAARTPIQVNVTQPATATFSYPATGSKCAGSTGTVTPTLATGATAGTYTSTTGLTLNATTGVVNLATSTAGTYTVTNTVGAAGICAAQTATTTITINPTPARPTLAAGYNGTVTTLTSSSATGNQFYFNGVAIAGATGQTYVVNGSATTYGSYTVVVTNTFGCSSSASVASVVTGTKSSIAGASIQLYPNPTPDGRATLELSGLRSATQLTVLDALGRVVRNETLPATTGVVTRTLDLARLASGVYVLRLSNNEGVETRRLTRE
ncbi:MAG: beta strand repeat-containing protein [Janthinobacterium lividum]